MIQIDEMLFPRQCYLLSDAFDDVTKNPEIRVVILSSTGSVFSAGHDLKEMTSARQNMDGGRDYFHKILLKCSTVMQKIIDCPKPVIAEVDGVATASGCQLVASCDLAVASYDAQFCTPGVHIGLFCSTPMVAISRNLSNKHAMEMLLTGDMVSAARAAEIGLINKVVAADELETESIALAKKYRKKSSLALAIGKSAFYRQREMCLKGCLRVRSASHG